MGDGQGIPGHVGNVDYLSTWGSFLNAGDCANERVAQKMQHTRSSWKVFCGARTWCINIF